MAEKFGNYEITRPIGRGGMATVYEAVDTRLRRRVALKVVRIPEHDADLRQEILARFRQEATIAANLHHPGVVTVHDFDEAADTAWLAMEFVDGETLKARLERTGPPGATETATLVTEVLRTLAYCHQAGVLHRDIKPSNLLLPKSGGVKLTDFGVARSQQDLDRTAVLTRTGAVLGTMAYMSPEQFTGRFPIDGRSDLWSCGVVLFEMLTGERLFSGDDSQILYKVVHGDLPMASSRRAELAPAWDRVLDQALARDPAQRFTNTDAFATAIADAMQPAAQPVPSPPQAVQAAPSPAPDRASKSDRRGWGRIAAGSLVLLLLAGGGAKTWQDWTAREAARQEQEALQRRRDEKAEAARVEAARQEAARLEAAHQEAARLEAARQEDARQEAARQEAARNEAVRREEARQQALRREAERQEAARQEAARQEGARQEAARQEIAGKEAIPRRPPIDLVQPTFRSDLSSWNHNGSVMAMEMAGERIRIWYSLPRNAISTVGVRGGTLLFFGIRNGIQVEGTAYVFKAGCGPAPYLVSGTLIESRSLELTGAAPIWAREPPCSIARYDTAIADGVLQFSFMSHGSGRP